MRTSPWSWSLALFVVGCASTPGTHDASTGDDATSLERDASRTDATSATDASDDGDAGPEVSPDADLMVQVFAQCSLDNAAPLTSCATQAGAAASDLAHMPVDDAVVTVTPAGGATAPVPSQSGGIYSAALTGFATSYRFAITHGTDHVAATVASPSDFTVTLSPSTLAANTATTASWATATENGVVANVTVTDSTSSMQTFSMTSADTGSLAIPASAFPHAGAYQIVVLRDLYPSGQSPLVHGHVQIFRNLTVTVR